MNCSLLVTLTLILMVCIFPVFVLGFIYDDARGIGKPLTGMKVALTALILFLVVVIVTVLCLIFE